MAAGARLTGSVEQGLERTDHLIQKINQSTHAEKTCQAEEGHDQGDKNGSMDDVCIQESKGICQVSFVIVCKTDFMFKGFDEIITMESDYKITDEETRKDQEGFLVDGESEKRLPEAEPEGILRSIVNFH
jgi:hypothetical protein